MLTPMPTNFNCPPFLIKRQGKNNRGLPLDRIPNYFAINLEHNNNSSLDVEQDEVDII